MPLSHGVAGTCDEYHRQLIIFAADAADYFQIIIFFHCRISDISHFIRHAAGAAFRQLMMLITRCRRYSSMITATLMLRHFRVFFLMPLRSSRRHVATAAVSPDAAVTPRWHVRSRTGNRMCSTK